MQYGSQADHKCNEQISVERRFTRTAQRQFLKQQSRTFILQLVGYYPLNDHSSSLCVCFALLFIKISAFKREFSSPVWVANFFFKKNPRRKETLAGIQQ